ncbi:CHAT domain-containing protein, partial [Dactylonectria macrodidyma]
MDALEEAIQVTQEAVTITPTDHPAQQKYASNLANYLGNRYLRTGSTSDLDEAIQLSREAVAATPTGYNDRGMYSGNLGMQLGLRHTRNGSVDDLEEAIRVSREAVDTIPGGHMDRAAYLSSLGNQFGARYLSTGSIGDLEQAIQLIREAIDATPAESPDRIMYYTNLGIRLGDRFLRTGNIADLEEAIRLAKKVVEATPDNHPSRPERLDNLANRLSTRYHRTGSLEDLEASIAVTRDSISATSNDHGDRPTYAGNLGLRLGERYSLMGSMEDLQEAIQFCRELVAATPEDHRDRPGVLNNLGNHLRNRHIRTGAMNDLEESIQIGRDALELTPTDHPLRAGRLSNLGSRLASRCSKTGETADLDEAIRLTKEALDIRSTDHPEWAKYASILATRFKEKYGITGALDDLEEATRLSQGAVDATPHDHADRGRRMSNLGNHLSAKYLKTGDISALKKSLSYRKACLNQTNALNIDRILGGRQVVRICALLHDWEQAYEASTISIPLIPKLVLRSLSNSDKQHILSEINGVASDAAAAALNAHKGPLAALRFLEQGRGVLGTSLQELRTDVLDLQQKYPRLAAEFSRLQSELEQHATSSEVLEHGVDPYKNTASQRRYDTGKQLDRLIAEIRQQPEFEDFLLAPRIEEIQDAAKYGPIVIINVSEYRCDAIMIQPDRIRQIPFHHITEAEMNEMVRESDLGRPEVLSWLWDEIAEPILNTLGFTDPPVNEWPRVWWIPTGPLAKFPIHAAGNHAKGSSDTVLDRVMSSYSSSVKAIIDGRRRHIPAVTPDQALLISMKTTPGHSSLPFAAKEIDTIRGLCKTMGLDTVEPPRRKQNIISSMPQCQIFHFAGHGHTNGLDPSKSQLVLEDGRTDPLTVADLLGLNLRKHSPFLAYLSACGTGQIKEEKFFDESIHLISGCQLSGFRHVIGTLWEVNDELCVDMARMTYKGIHDGGMTDLSVCQGLHNATRHLRDRWLGLNANTMRAKTIDDTKLGKGEEARDACPTAGRGDRLPRD